MWNCVLGAALFLGGILGGPQRSPLRLDEWHHEYAGAAACVVGQLAHSRLIVQVGGTLALDDGEQHLFQRVNRDLGIRSPLNVGYRVSFGRLPLFKALNRLLDDLLH